MEVINNLKEVACSNEQESIVLTKIKNLRLTIENEHEGFMDIFLDKKNGVYFLQQCLVNPHITVKQQVFEIVPHFFKLAEARKYIRGKLDFFTSLYEFLGQDDLRLRHLAVLMFIQILQKLSKGATAFNLVTKSATTSA